MFSNRKLDTLSDSDTTSSTEKHVSRRLAVPRQSDSQSSRKLGSRDASNRSDQRVSSSQRSHSGLQDSDEDATLNEVIGKFDESYVYEKETDILRYVEIIFSSTNSRRPKICI